jgi:hypothetical protein
MVIEPVFSAAKAATLRERTRVSTIRMDKNRFMANFLSVFNLIYDRTQSGA